MSQLAAAKLIAMEVPGPELVPIAAGDKTIAYAGRFVAAHATKRTVRLEELAAAVCELGGAHQRSAPQMLDSA